MNQKSIIAVLGVVVVILIGTTLYLTTINKASTPVVPTPKVTQQPVPTTNSVANNALKTYQNQKYGFEFMYPKEFGNINVEEVDVSGNRGVQKGKKINLSFDGKNNISITAYTEDFESFSPFELAFESNYICPKPLSYDEKGSVCKTVTLPSGNAIFRNIFLEIEGGIDTETAVLFHNKSNSEFTKFAFVVKFGDFNKRLETIYATLPTGYTGAIGDKEIKEMEKVRQEALAEGLVHSKKIMEGKALSEIDNADLTVFNQIISTFKFTK